MPLINPDLQNSIIQDSAGKKVDVVTTADTRNRLCVDTVIPTDPATIVQTGNAFYLNSLTPLTVAAGSDFDVMIVTGTTKEIHLKDVSVNVLKNASGGNTQFQLFEAITTSANGTAAIILNNNRRLQGIINPNFTAFTTPTVTGTGTQLIGYLTHNDWETYVAPSYTNTWEYILKTDTKYLLRFFNNTNQSNTFTYLYWLYQDTI